jgi:hypothetical protein
MKTSENQGQANIGANKTHEQRTRSWDDIDWRSEAPSYVPTREEVFQLVKCWYKRFLWHGTEEEKAAIKGAAAITGSTPGFQPAKKQLRRLEMAVRRPSASEYLQYAIH